MEALKTFESLSACDKLRFFEALINDSKEASDNQDGTHHARSPEKSNLNSFFENLKKVSSGLSPESKSQVKDSKKQKTLDGWVIKRNDGSSPKGKVGQSSSQNTKSDVRSLSDSMSETSSHPDHLTTINEENDLHIKDKSVEKKSSYKMRKRKNTKLQQPIETNNTLSTESKSNKLVNDKLTNNNEPSLNLTPSQQSNYEAFLKLSRLCTSAGLNILDILQDEKIQTMLNNYESLCSDAVVFIGSFKSSMGRMLPIVHLAQSRKKLLESLTERQAIK